MATHNSLKSIAVASKLVITAITIVLTGIPLSAQERLLSRSTFTNPLTGE